MDSQGALGDIINSLLNNPEIMKTVSTLARGQSESESEPDKTDEKENIQIPPELLSSLPQMMSALSSSKKDSQNSKRKELLLALKPFLSEKRCSVIDGILQFEGLAGMLDALKP